MARSEFQEELIKRFKSCFDSNFESIVKEFLKQKEHSNLYVTFEDLKDKAIERFDLLSRNIATFPLQIDANLLVETLQNTNLASAGGWISSIVETLRKEHELESMEEVIEFIQQNSKEAEVCISQATMTTNLKEYTELKSFHNLAFLNLKFIDNVDADATTVYCMETFNHFITTLERQNYPTSLKVFRSISTEKPQDFITNMLMLSKEDQRPLGSSWSKASKRAVSYEGEPSHYHIKIHGNVSLDAVDYEMTIVKNLSVTYGGFEEEMFLKSGQGQEVEVTKVEVFDSHGEQVREFDLIALDKVRVLSL